MSRISLRSIACVSILSAVFSLSMFVGAQEPPKPQVATPAKEPAAQAGQSAKLTAKLMDAEKKAKQKAATVEVMVDGIELVDPGSVSEQPKSGQGHLHYQVDGGPVIATTATKLSFHGLSTGQHKIVVMLAGNDHTPLGPQETLTVTVP
jgi:hypothetical protein